MQAVDVCDKIYEKQVRELAAAHRRKHDAETNAEYLSGLTREDRIIPVITLVVNFGDMRWDGPLSFCEMVTQQPEEVLALLPEYRVCLIDPMAMQDEDFERLHSSLREVLLCIRAQKDKQQMRRLLQADDRFAHLDRDAALVIRAMTHTKFEIDEHAEVVNMCEAIQGMIDDGIMQGRVQGRAEGMNDEKRKIALRLLRMGLSAKQIEEATNLSEDEIAELQTKKQ